MCNYGLDRTGLPLESGGPPPWPHARQTVGTTALQEDASYTL